MPAKSVGALDIYNDFSFFEVEKSLSDKILEDLKGKEYDSKSFVVEIASQNGGKKEEEEIEIEQEIEIEEEIGIEEEGRLII